MNFTPEEIWNEIGQLHMENAKQKIQIAQYESHIKSLQPSQTAAVVPTAIETIEQSDPVQA